MKQAPRSAPAHSVDGGDARPYLTFMSNVIDVVPPGVDRFQVRKPMPPAQFDALSKEILDLKKKLNAVILAHNYQVPEIQDVADYVGDSLGLSQQAAKTNAEVIVFCGVHFMAETAKILNPHKVVVLPDKDAGCSLEAELPGPESSRQFQATNPNFYTIAYINCSAEVKALSDVICTSGNAVKIVNAAPKDRDLLFVPDENLGSWVMEQTGRPMTLWRGNCYVHVEWTHASITRIRREFPDAPLVAHPECTKAVRMLADEVCSTEKMVSLLQKVSCQADHHRHRSGHAPSPAKGNARTKPSFRADRQLPLQRVPLHENEHARKSSTIAWQTCSRGSNSMRRRFDARGFPSNGCWKSARGPDQNLYTSAVTSLMSFFSRPGAGWLSYVS